MRDIYSEKVILFALAMEGPTTWLKKGDIDASAWAKQAVVVRERYDIPLGIIEQQAWRAHPDAYAALATWLIAVMG